MEILSYVVVSKAGVGGHTLEPACLSHRALLRKPTKGLNCNGIRARLSTASGCDARSLGNRHRLGTGRNNKDLKLSVMGEVRLHPPGIRFIGKDSEYRGAAAGQ